MAKIARSGYGAILKRKGSKCTCPICGKPCEGGEQYLKTGKMTKAMDITGCKHYDGWEWDIRNKVMRHYFRK